MELEQQIGAAIRIQLPGRRVEAVRERDTWVRRLVEVTLDGGEEVIVKIAVQRPGSLEGGETIERDVAGLLAPQGLSVVPPVLAVDSSCEILPQPYVIQIKVGGRRLSAWLAEAPEEGTAIYEVVGRVYAKIHGVHNDRDGLWNGSTPCEPWGAPTDYMVQAEIVEGSGRRALEEGRISRASYDLAVRLWRDHLDYLRAHQPTLVHASAFPWTIYLDREGDDWRVTKLTSVGDFLWWDPAFDVAALRFPPFGEMRVEWWAGFLKGYGAEPERRRLLLYAVMQRLCAAMGCYMAPAAPGDAAWVEQAFVELEAMLQELHTP
jgi:hypothetical protein